MASAYNWTASIEHVSITADIPLSSTAERLHLTNEANPFGLYEEQIIVSMW